MDNKAKDVEKGWEEDQTKKKEELEELVGDIAEVLQDVLLCKVIYLAKSLRKKGYKKFNEDCVVLTSRELADSMGETWKQSSNKTAKDILFKFESAFAYYDNKDMFSKKAIFECLEEITKQVVDTKEN